MHWYWIYSKYQIYIVWWRFVFEFSTLGWENNQSNLDGSWGLQRLRNFFISIWGCCYSEPRNIARGVVARDFRAGYLSFCSFLNFDFFKMFPLFSEASPIFAMSSDLRILSSFSPRIHCHIFESPRISSSPKLVMQFKLSEFFLPDFSLFLKKLPFGSLLPRGFVNRIFGIKLVVLATDGFIFGIALEVFAAKSVKIVFCLGLANFGIFEIVE